MDTVHRDPAVSLTDILRSSTTARIKGLKLADWLIGRCVMPWLTPRPEPPEPFTPSRVRRLLVIRPGGIGDAVLVVPLLRRLRRLMPQARIEVLAERRNAEVFALAPGACDAVWCYDRHPARLWRTLRRAPYDVVLDTEQWHALSALLALASGAPRRVGFETNPLRVACYTRRVPYAHETYEAVSFLRLLDPLVGGAGEEPENRPLLCPPDSLQDWAGRYLAGRRAVAVSVRGGIRERDWDAANLRQLLLDMKPMGVTVCLMGGRNDRRLAGRICRDASFNHVINCAGRFSLGQAAAVIQRCAAWIGTDSGFMHIADGVGTPVVALFGSGIQSKWAPRDPRHRIINRHVPCSPCTRFGYTPRCHVQVRCLREIAPDAVAQAVRSVLGPQGMP